jgi:hypothetical protein
MRMRMLRRPIVFLRVRCSILILLIITVRCSIPHCVCVSIHTHTLMVFFCVWNISSVKLFLLIDIDENLSSVIPRTSWNCVKKMAAYLTLSEVAHMITHRLLNCQGKDFHTGRKQHPKCRFDVLIGGLDTGSTFVSCLKAVRYHVVSLGCLSEVLSGIWLVSRFFCYLFVKEFVVRMYVIARCNTALY